jgi:predicted nucleic acid-binding Zn finger protein
MERKLSNKNKYSFIILDGNNKIGQVGTGFIVMKKTRKYILGFLAYNKEICKLNINGKYNNITLINVHAPALDKTDEDEQFYEDIRSVADKVKKAMQNLGKN